MNRILKSLQKPLVTLFLLCLFPMGALAQNVVVQLPTSTVSSQSRLALTPLSKFRMSAT